MPSYPRAFFSIVFFIIFFSIAMCTAEPILITTGEWAPYTGEKLDGNGYCCEIVAAAFKSENVEVKFMFVPWKRAEKMVEGGDAFGCIPYTASGERKKRFDFSDPIAFTRGVFFYRKDRYHRKPAWTELSDLKSYKIGGVLGYWYEKEKVFEKAGVTVEYTTKDSSNVKKLDVDRVDLLILDEIQGWELIKTTLPGKVKHFATIDKPLNESGLFVMVSRKYPNANNILKKFNKGLETLKSSPEYEVILKKYGLE